MKIQVVYHSMTGNTKKAAEAIAGAMGVEAVPASEAKIPEPVDLLFVGDGMYAGGISRAMKDFIESLDGSSVRMAAVFNTSGGSWWFGPNSMKKRLRKKGISVAPESFHCHGGAFGFVFAAHPNEKDLAHIREFAERVRKSADSETAS